MQRNLDPVGSALNLDFGQAGRSQFGIEEFSDLHIFMKIGCIVLVCVPPGVPSLDDTDAKTMRIDFLSHCDSLLRLVIFP